MFEQTINDHISCIKNLADIKDIIIKAGEMLTTSLEKGNRILICGNGGSAADSQHFAAEIVGRFEKERTAWPALALTTDTSIITAIANDYTYDDIFSRQVEGLGASGDIIIGISTSGNSKNVIHAINKAKNMEIKTIALLGNDGGHLNTCADLAVTVSSTVTARIQEAHIFILHFWAKMIEQYFTNES
ncbi:MAG: D-sedoheptulose 7-phosphate isomerase [Desulfobacterales bacterium]|nr:D-sedoheptulose 7-phosphate isomerase [Desulfobacterales bacterium]